MCCFTQKTVTWFPASTTGHDKGEMRIMDWNTIAIIAITLAAFAFIALMGWLSIRAEEKDRTKGRH